jgi:hypothetical protein
MGTLRGCERRDRSVMLTYRPVSRSERSPRIAPQRAMQKRIAAMHNSCLTGTVIREQHAPPPNEEHTT